MTHEENKNISQYYCETPKERLARRHEEDKINNPDRHNPIKDSYRRDEALNLCGWCAPNFINDYIYDPRTDMYIRIAKDT